jgi:AAA domain
VSGNLFDGPVFGPGTPVIEEPPWPTDAPFPPEPDPEEPHPERNGHRVTVVDHTGTTPAHLRYPALDWQRVFDGAAPDIDWLVTDFIAAGQSYSLVSQAKAGKSLLMLDVVSALATGRSTLGNPARAPVRVLYVDLENSLDDLVERLRDMGYQPADLDRLRYLSFPSLPALDSPAGGAEIAELAEYHDAALVVIDTVARVTVGEENNADTFRHLYRYTIAPLKAQRRAVVRLDHEGHVKGRSRGSSAKNDDVDVVWQLAQRLGDDGETYLTLKLERQRGSSHPAQLYLKREPNPRLHHIAKLPILSHPDRQRVGECIEVMIQLGLPAAETGARKARIALREANHRFGSDAIAAAVRARKAAAVSPEIDGDTSAELFR